MSSDLCFYHDQMNLFERNISSSAFNSLLLKMINLKDIINSLWEWLPSIEIRYYSLGTGITISEKWKGSHSNNIPTCGAENDPADIDEIRINTKQCIISVLHQKSTSLLTECPLIYNIYLSYLETFSIRSMLIRLSQIL